MRAHTTGVAFRPCGRERERVGALLAAASYSARLSVPHSVLTALCVADRVAAALPVCCGRESCGAARAVCRVQALPAASARRAASSRALHWSTSLFWSRRRLAGLRCACAALTASVAMLCIVHVRALRRSQGTKRHERREARGAGAVPRSESATLHMRGTRAERPRTSQKRAPRVQRDREARRRPNHVSVRAVQAGREAGRA